MLVQRRLWQLVTAAGLLMSAFLGIGFSSSQVDWSSCQDDLDRVRRSARDASDYAAEVESNYDKLQNCVRDPDTYDLLADGCRSYRQQYQDAKETLNSELDTLDSRLRSVQYSCGYRFSLGAPRADTGNSTCQTLQTYKGRLPDSQLLSLCKARMTEAECKQCLGLR